MTVSVTKKKPANPGAQVEVRDVHKVFGDGVNAIERLDFKIPAGQFVSILGPSGCGKSTLLRLVSGLDDASGGTISVDGVNVNRKDGLPRGTAAYVFQDAQLLPWRNVLANVVLPLELAGVPKNQRLEQATAALAQVSLSDALTRYPAQLSGGMRMRVSLARALVTRPRLLLLDEPFAALDELTRFRLDEMLYELWQKYRMTVMFVTHSVSEAAFLSQRALVLSAQPARMVTDQVIDLPPERDSALRTKPRFIGKTQMLLSALMQGGA